MTEARDWAEMPYVRVYQSIKDDPKFVAVYGDDRALAAWLRLLLDADAAWPARLGLPAHLSRHARDVLTKAGILAVAGGTYTISGLAKERGGRAERRPPMTAAERVRRWRERQELGNDPALRPVTVGNDDVTPSRARAPASASVSVVTSSPEGGAGGNHAVPPLTRVIDYLEQRTGRDWHSRPGSNLWDTLNADLRDFGEERLLTAYRAVQADHPDFGQIVFRATKDLHPIGAASKPADTEPDPEWVAQKLAEQRAARRAGGSHA